MAESLRTVVSSLESTLLSIENLLESDDVKNLDSSSPGISLLNLKSSTVASYLHHLALRSLYALNELDTEKEKDGNLDSNIRKLVVTDRVVLERGVRPLEKKIDYQVNKLLRAATAPPRIHSHSQKHSGSESDSDQDSSSSSNEDDDDDDDGDNLLLSYKPRPNLLSAPKQPTTATTNVKQAKYVPPKINPTKLPSTRSSSVLDRNKKPVRIPKNRALEEYLEQTTSNLPESSVSVGSNVLEHGRGGTRTRDAQAKEDRVRGYEEENYVRLPEDGKKKRKKQRNDEFMGENWDFTGADYSSVKRKKKSVWDRNR
ncbi:hypothetical protein V1512DRAFT_275498 [Lipomyces arxii]|uniref:uncharacterized protein n=1 Tax=Lipomyces arxii TaxID=56418 RepID=UPI0034CFBA55